VQVGFRYWTDVAAIEPGFMVDDILVGGQPLEDAETDSGWIYEGFNRTTGTETTCSFNACVAEYRQYRGYDDSPIRDPVTSASWTTRRGVTGWNISPTRMDCW
jgi:immune inhibitor A